MYVDIFFNSTMSDSFSNVNEIKVNKIQEIINKYKTVIY